MKRLALLLVSIMLLANTGCTTEEEAETREPMPNPAETLLDEQTETEAWEVHEATKVHITFHATIENPTSGALLSAYLVLPPTPKNSTEKYPIAVMIPGGTDYGTNAYGKDTHIREFLLEKEIGFAYFDPDGRGESAGEENANGHIHQDGLFAVTEALTQHTNVDTNKMGIISYSYGTTLASGMLSRYADQNPYKWYLDWEGPSKREYTTVNCKGDLGNVILNIDCADEEFWSQRESATFLETIQIPYWRLQNGKDHVQDSNEHAIDAINAATNGLSPWTRINNEAPNQTYTYTQEPTYLNRNEYEVLDYALELFELF